MKLSGKKNCTYLYIKSTNRQQYLHYTSSHPEKTKKSLVYSKALRLSCICSEEKGVPLVVTYHPLLKSIGKIIYDNLNLLYKNEELKQLFTPDPMVSFRSSRKMSSYLVRTKLYLVERSVGSFNCKRPHCHVCAYANETDKFTSTVTK